MEVLPVINCGDSESVEERFAVLKTFLKKGDFVHVDVADGIFTFHKTWNDMAGWKKMKIEFPLEVHLMVEHPEEWIAPWLEAGAKRFVLPIEAIDTDSLADVKHRRGMDGVEIVLSSNPETAEEEFTPYVHETSRFQILCVNPGLAGQKFLPLALEKAMWIRYAVPHAIIEVDGGITPETAKWAKEADAKIIVSASYIFGSEDPKKAYEELRKI